MTAAADTLMQAGESRYTPLYGRHPRRASKPMPETSERPPMSIGDLIRLDLANRGSVRYDDSPELRTWEEVQDWFWNRPPRQKSIRCKLFGHYETLRYRDRFTYLECDRCGAAKRPPCFEEDD